MLANWAYKYGGLVVVGCLQVINLNFAPFFNPSVVALTLFRS